MIQSITIINYRDDSFTFTLRDPEQSGFFVESIDGLDPPPTTLNTSPLIGSDGAIFNSSRVEPRNIVLMLGMLNGTSSSVETLRQKTYKIFPLKTLVKIRVTHDSGERRDIQGYVESNEVKIFSKRQIAQISIMCVDPFFTDGITPVLTTIEGYATPLFEFPFEGPDLELSSITTATSKWIVVENPGDNEVGAIFQVEFGVETTGLAINEYNEAHTTILKQMYTQPLSAIFPGDSTWHAGDVLTISTVKGDKYATLIRDSTEYDLLGLFLKSSQFSWIYIHPGETHIRVVASTGINDLIVSISFATEYQGV